jgi:DNA-binding LacI/PurR family transcriptional regulator/DNA-binding transcriptional regulator YhcF (GntR family)
MGSVHKADRGQNAGHATLTPAPRRIVQQLRRRLLAGEFTTGARLPSVRQLARSTGFSVFTVQQALKQAERERWVERGGGNGSLRVSVDAVERVKVILSQQAPPVVHLVCPLDRRFGQSHLFSAYAEGISRHFGGCVIRRTYIDMRRGEDAVRRLILENASSGHEVGYVLLWMPAPLKTVFDASDAACVIVGHADKSLSLPCIYEDMYQVGYLTGQILCARGQMMLLHARELIGAEVQIIDGARRAARETGLVEPRWEHFHHSVPEDIGAAEAEVHRLLSRRDRPTGILALRPELALMVVKIAARLQIQIPEDLEVIGYANSPVFRLVHPEITSIGPESIEDLGRRCGQLLAELFGRRPPTAARELVDSILIERESTRPLPTATNRNGGSAALEEHAMS